MSTEHDFTKPLTYDPAMNDIPLEVLQAARTLSDHFEKRGSEYWTLGGVCSRNHADRIREIVRAEPIILGTPPMKNMSKNYSWNPSPEVAFIQKQICLHDLRVSLDKGLNQLISDLGDTVIGLQEDGATRITFEYSNMLDSLTNPDQMCPTITVRAERPPK